MIWKAGGFVAGSVFALVVLAWLALHRPDIPYATLEQRYATPQSRYLDLPGREHVHVRDTGPAAGVPIVLVHGYSASSRDWDAWIDRLSPRHRVIALDLPGHGLTRTPKDYAASNDAFVRVVDEATRSLGVGPFVLAGNSMGGGVAWRFALAHPDRLKGLVLVDAAGWAEAKPGKSGAVLFKLLESPIGRAVIADTDSTPFARQGLKSAFVDERLVTPALVRRYTDLSRGPGHRRILLNIEQGQPATPARLGAIMTPTLVMVGEQDHLIPAADGKRFADAIPGATLIAYPGVGHVPMEQIPDRSAADLEAWISKAVSAPDP